MTTTDANGDYSFTYLANGTYDVVVTRPAGGTPTYDPDTGSSGPFDDQTQVTLGSDATGVDFGYDVQSAIGGVVWSDADRDGVIDGGENGIAGATLELRHAGCTAGVDCPTDTTDGGGGYEFNGLSSGVAYTVWVNECTLTSGVRTSTTANNPYVHTLAPAEIVSDADFGYTGSLPFFEGFESAADEQKTHTATIACLPGAPAFSYDNNATAGQLRLRANEDWTLGSRDVIAQDFHRTGTASALLDHVWGLPRTT